MTLVRSLLAVLALVAVSGCALRATPIYGRDGQTYQYIEAGPFWRTLEDCYETANVVCPSGYRVTDDVAPRSYYGPSLIVRCN